MKKVLAATAAHRPVEDPLEGNNHPELVIASLSQIIRYNKNLMHLDLENTGLSEYVITKLVYPLRHSKSLLSFHLGQNPGITEEVTEFLK